MLEQWDLSCLSSGGKCMLRACAQSFILSPTTHRPIPSCCAPLTSWGSVPPITASIPFTPHTYPGITTWFAVGVYNNNIQRMNTFQLAFASDGVRSFAIIIEDNLLWNSGSASTGYVNIGEWW